MKNKAIILTLRLWWFYLIYKGNKTEEIRKTCPRDFRGDVYGYVSKTKWKEDLAKIPECEREFFKRFIGKVGLKFTLNEIRDIYVIHFPTYYLYKTSDMTNDQFKERSGLSQIELDRYLRKKKGYCWHIENLIHYAEPKPIDQFIGTKRSNLSVRNYAPQSWCYCNQIQED